MKTTKLTLIAALAAILFTSAVAFAHPDTDATKRPCHNEATPCRFDGR